MRRFEKMEKFKILVNRLSSDKDDYILFIVKSSNRDKAINKIGKYFAYHLPFQNFLIVDDSSNNPEAKWSITIR
jgi:uncharacterized protein YukJ